MANSEPVVIASDQSTVPVSLASVPSHAVTNAGTFAVQSTNSDVVATGNITTQNLVPAGTATANSAVLSGTLNGHGTATVQVTGTYTGALSLQGTTDNSTWVTISFGTFANVNTGAVATTITSAATGIYQVDCKGFRQIRVTGLAAMTGTATVTIRASINSGFVVVDGALPTGANVIGAVTQSGTWNIGTVTPGTAATNLAKARDSAIGATDTGVAILGVRRDTPTAETPIAGDYVVPQISANGEQWVRLAGELADDAAFTVATTRVLPTGLLADETSPDSVDEGDIGIPRMTLDRKAIVTAYPSSTTGDGLSVANFNSGDTFTALTSTAQVVKASAGNFYGYYIYNPNSAATYVILYNVAAVSVTVGTTTPAMVFCIPATSGANLSLTYPIPFTNAGWSIAATTTGGGNTAPATALEAMIFYK